MSLYIQEKLHLFFFPSYRWKHKTCRGTSRHVPTHDKIKNDWLHIYIRPYLVDNLICFLFLIKNCYAKYVIYTGFKKTCRICAQES